MRLTVYRESTAGRTASLPVTVASELLTRPHPLVHRPLGNMAFGIIPGEPVEGIKVRTRDFR